MHSSLIIFITILFLIFKNMFIDFREREEKKVEGREKRERERETLISCLLYEPRLGSNPQPFGAQDDAPTN